MKRLEKVNVKNTIDISNGNRSGDVRQEIIRSLSRNFSIDSIELVDNRDLLCDDLRNLDDDVFAKKSGPDADYPENLSSSAPVRDYSFGFEKMGHRRSLGDDNSKNDNRYRREDLEKQNEDPKKEACRIGRARRASDVIDSIGDDCINLRPPCETGGIAIATPRSRTSSDLGYSGSFTSTSSGTSFTFPQPTYMVGEKNANDLTDSKPFTDINKGSTERLPEATMSTDRDADEYNMLHPRRGRAIIINNDTFDNNLANPRKGSQVDVQSLEEEFHKLGFEVTVIYNPTFHELKEYIYEISQEDHSDADCLMIAVLTHGMNDGWLFARDTLYKVDNLWLPFTADRCLTLAGKPKIFFVQACRGNQTDSGVTMINRKGSVSETDAATSAYKLPSHSDFVVAYSTTDGFYSWRNPEEGTWFIQSLVKELSLNGTQISFLDLMTRVNRRVAVHFSSYNEDASWLHDRKQVPTFQSTLIRVLKFRPKPTY